MKLHILYHMVKDIVHHELLCFRLNPIKASRDTTINLFPLTIIFFSLGGIFHKDIVKDISREGF